MFVVHRSPSNPLLSPRLFHPWEAKAAFNWCPVFDKKNKKLVHCLYRALAEEDLIPNGNLRISSIGYAASKNGISYNNRSQFIKPERDWERYGCEDPRVTELNGKYYIFYTALSLFPFRHTGIKVGCAITRDFKTIESKHLVTPFNSKAMTLFPAKVRGKFTALLTVHTDNVKRRSRIAIAQFDREEDMWNPAFWEKWLPDIARYEVRMKRSLMDHVEVGAPPLKTKDGWLLIYSHIQNYRTKNKIFGIEAVLLDSNNPVKIIGRTQHPIMVPEESYEQYGMVPNVIFPSGALINKGNLEIFYGSTDTTSCMATVRLEDLLRTIKREKNADFVVRAKKNPIIKPNPKHGWESQAIFNPAAIDLGGKIHILYRAMSNDNTSTVGYASSRDGVTIDYRHPEPIYTPRLDYEGKNVPNGNSGCEDPRIVQIGDTLYMCYTAYNGTSVPRVALSTISVKNFLEKRWKWSYPILITPENIDDKDACLFPEKFHGKYLVVHRIKHHVCFDAVSSTLTAVKEMKRGIHVLGPRYGMWDSKKIGLAGQPLKTKAGWLLFYHGIGEDTHYRMGAALLDLKNPTTVLARTNQYIMGPLTRYERQGVVNNVVFPCGHVIRGDTIFHYYGGADSVLGVATMKLSTLIKTLT